jgi:hypothetical protein
VSKPKSFKENLAIWRTLASNLGARLEDLPHLRDLHAALVALLAEAEALQDEQALYAAKLRQVNHDRAVAARAGRALRNRIAYGLQGALGPESAQLIEFCVPPRASRARRQGATTEPGRRAAKTATRKAAAEDVARPGDRPPVS